MSRIAFTGLVLVLLLFTALGSSAQSQDEFTVVPGRGIGRIALGMTINEVVAMLGVPKSTHSTSSSSLTRYSWFEEFLDSPGATGNRHLDQGGLSVSANRSGIVIVVSVYMDARYVVNGLHTRDRKYDRDGGQKGSSEAQVKAMLREPVKNSKYSDKHSLEYSNLGLTFWIGDDSRENGYREVYQLDVYPPAR